MFSLIWLKEISVLLIISFLLILIGSWKRVWKFVKQTLHKKIIASSPVYFIAFMIVSYNHFYVTSCTDNTCSVDVPVSADSNTNGLSIKIFKKTSISTFKRAAL